MDVSMPITTVVPSLGGPFLAALAATADPMGLGTVHERAGRGSKSGIRSVLLRLVDEGLVLEVPGGYVLNRGHLAALAVELLAGLHGELTNRIRRTVEPSGADMAKNLQRLLNRKDDSQYGLPMVSSADASRMVGWAKRRSRLARKAVES